MSPDLPQIVCTTHDEETIACSWQVEKATWMENREWFAKTALQIVRETNSNE